MDKEILAVIGRLYLDIIALNNHIDIQNKKIRELEAITKNQSDPE